jgi:tetratricopeptide (TPR) repeat protein
MSERQYDKAQATYNAILKENPKNFAAHRQLSDLYRRQGKYDDAQRELELAAECCDDPIWKPELHEKLASTFQARQKLPEAIEQWKKAISSTQDPEDACRRRLRLALLYQKMGEKDDALKLYQEIVDTSKNPGLRNYAQYFLKRAQK